MDADPVELMRQITVTEACLRLRDAVHKFVGIDPKYFKPAHKERAIRIFPDGLLLVSKIKPRVPKKHTGS